MSNPHKIREDRLRRAARRQGYLLVRNPRRDRRAVDYGSYKLRNLSTGAVIADFGWDQPAVSNHLDDVEAYLTKETAMTTITLYATNSDLVFAQKDDGPIWSFGPVTPDMYGEFADLARGWHEGEWEPNEADGQTTTTSDGLDAVAVWDSKDGTITYPAGAGVDRLGGAAYRWIFGEDI